MAQIRTLSLVIVAFWENATTCIEYSSLCVCLSVFVFVFVCVCVCVLAQ